MDKKIERIEGVVRADEAYTLPEFQKRTGLGDFALHQARRDGLAVREVGKKRFVFGGDWINYITRPREAADSGKSN